MISGLQAAFGALEVPDDSFVAGGVQLSTVTESDVVERVFTDLDRGTGGIISTVNTDYIRIARADDAFRALISAAELRIADGMPLVWLSRRRGCPLPARITGTDLLWTLSAHAADRGRSVYLLGAAEGVADRAAAELLRLFPGLTIAGTHSPPWRFESDAHQLAAVKERLAASGADIVFVALGAPRQDRFIAANRELLPRAWWMGVGAGIDFVAKEQRRAPRFMRTLGLEWFFRMVREPRRLGRRYLLHDLPCLIHLLREPQPRRSNQNDVRRTLIGHMGTGR